MRIVVLLAIALVLASDMDEGDVDASDNSLVTSADAMDSSLAMTKDATYNAVMEIDGPVTGIEYTNDSGPEMTDVEPAMMELDVPPSSTDVEMAASDDGDMSISQLMVLEKSAYAWDRFWSQQAGATSAVVVTCNQPGVAQQLFSLASGILYGLATKRRVALGMYSELQALLKLDASFDYPIGMIRNDNNTLTGVHCRGDPVNEAVVFLDTCEWIAPALSLNPQLTVPTELTFRAIADAFFMPNEKIAEMYHHRAAQIEAAPMIGVVVDPNGAASGSFYQQVHQMHQCLRDGFKLQPQNGTVYHVISVQGRYNHLMQEHFPRLLFQSQLDDPQVLLGEIMLQVKHADELLVYGDSSLGQLIVGWARPTTKSTFLQTANWAHCVSIAANATEPCYSQSLKQLYASCPQLAGADDFNPHDLLVYPEHLDSCKDMRRGLHIIR